MFGNHAYFTNNPIIPITAEIKANTSVAQSRMILNRSLESGVRGMDGKRKVCPNEADFERQKRRLWETKINCLNAISFILSAAAIAIAIVRLCL